MTTPNYGKKQGYRPWNGRSYHDQQHRGNQSYAQPPPKYYQQHQLPQQNHQQQQPPPSSQPYYFNPPPQHDEQSRGKPSSGTGQYQQGPPSGTGQYQQGPSSGTGQYQQGPSSGTGQYQQGPSSGTGQYQQGPSSGASQSSQGPSLGTEQHPQGPPSAPPGYQVCRVPIGYVPGYPSPNQGMPYQVAPIQMSMIPPPMMRMNYLQSTIPPSHLNMPMMTYAIYNGNANLNNYVQNPPRNPPSSQQSEIQNHKEQSQCQENSQQDNTGQQNGDHFSAIGKFDYRELPEYNQRRRPYQNMTIPSPQFMQQMQFALGQSIQQCQQYAQNQSFQENHSLQQGHQVIAPPIPQTTVPAPQYRNSPSVETNATRTDSAFDEGSSPRAPRAEVQTGRGTFTYTHVNGNEYCAKSVDGKYCFQVFDDPEIAIQQTVNAIVESEEKLARDAQQQSHLMLEKVNKLEQEVEELKLIMGENKAVQQEGPVQQDVTINVQPVPISTSHANVDRVVTQPEITQPVVLQADVAQHDVTKSNNAQPDVAQENAGQSDVSQPTTSRLHAVKPDVAEEGVAQSDVAQPKITEPDVVQPDVAQPAVAQSNVDQQAKVVHMEIELLDVLTSETSDNATVENGTATSQANFATIVEPVSVSQSVERNIAAEVVHMEIEVDDLLTSEYSVSTLGSQQNATKNSSHKQKPVARKSHTKQQKAASTSAVNANTVYAHKRSVPAPDDSSSASAEQNIATMKTRDEIAAEKKAKQEAEKRLAQQRKAEKERQAKLLKEKKKAEEEKRRLEKEAENEKRKAEKAAKLAEERAQREKEAREYKEKAKKMEKELAEEKEKKRQQRIEAKELKNARKAAQKAKEEEETKQWMEASKSFNDTYIPPLPKPRKDEEVALMFKKKLEKEAEKMRKQEMEKASLAPSTSESRTEHRRGDSFYKPSQPVQSKCNSVVVNESKNEPVPEDPKNAKKKNKMVEEEVVVDLPDFPEESE